MAWARARARALAFTNTRPPARSQKHTDGRADAHVHAPVCTGGTLVHASTVVDLLLREWGDDGLQVEFADAAHTVYAVAPLDHSKVACELGAHHRVPVPLDEVSDL